MMYWKYGNYQHPDAEVNLARMIIRPRMSRRGLRREMDYEFHCQGELHVTPGTVDAATCQADLHAKITALATAYSYDYQDAGLYHSDGTPTLHFLQSSHPSNLTGNHVLYRNWPIGGPEEYATCRTFGVGIGATFLDADSQIEAFQETVSVIGTGGPEFEVVECQDGLYVDQIIPQSKRFVIQEGYAIGISGYPLVQPPPLLPDYEHVRQRRVTSCGGRFRGQGYSDYTIRWRYVFETPAPGGSFIPALG